jgi:hypothetical protein
MTLRHFAPFFGDFAPPLLAAVIDRDVVLLAA